MYLLSIPDPEHERNLLEVGKIPYLLSLLATHSPTGEVRGLKDFPRDERPNVWLAYIPFRIMVSLAGIFVILAVVGWFKRNKLESSPGYLRIMQYAIPLPYLAATMGWTLTETGRQPWIVYGLMKTSQSVSPIAVSQVATTLVGFIALYSLLGFAAFYLIAKFARKGPEPLAASNE